MRVSQAFPSKFMKVGDLRDNQDTVVTIKKASFEEIGQGEDRKKKLVLYFHEIPKAAVLNKTMASVIAKLHGDDTDGWPGKRITLWVNHDVQFGSETVSAIRVRNRVPEAGESTAVGGLLTVQEALAACKAANKTRDDFVAWLKGRGVGGWNAERDSALLRAWLSPPASDDDIPPDADDIDVPVE